MLKAINLKGDLFATIFSFSATAAIRLASSLVLTRILYPEAYGIVAILSAIVFTIEMISDIGILGFMIRDKNGDDPRYINTAWTVRLIRSWINLAILFFSAPAIAALYGLPALTDWLRIFSLWFIFFGLESMSFVLAVRHKRARIVSYSELVCTILSTAFVIAYSHYSRNEAGMVYGMLLERLLRTLASYLFYRETRPRLLFDRTAARDLFGFSKFVMPSSWLSLVLGQFDRIVFLKLFDLKLLGLYGLANNIAGPIDALTSRVSRQVLFGRCAAHFRAGRRDVRERYYRENVKLFAATLFPPAAVAGASTPIVQLLYDSRYEYAGVILQAFAIRSILAALAGPAESLMAASERGSRVVLMGNLWRTAWLLPAAYIGYRMAGFAGFVYGVVLKELPPLVYFLWLQHKDHLLVVRFEMFKLVYMGAVVLLFVWIGSYLPSLRPLLLDIWTIIRHWFA